MSDPISKLLRESMRADAGHRRHTNCSSDVPRLLNALEETEASLALSRSESRQRLDALDLLRPAFDRITESLRVARDAVAELEAIREEIHADPAVKTVDAVAALRASAQCTIAERNDHIEDLEDTIRHLTSSRDATANKARREAIESCIRVCEEIERTLTIPTVAGLCAERLKDLLKGTP